jgi:hypothetical protein
MRAKLLDYRRHEANLSRLSLNPDPEKPEQFFWNNDFFPALDTVVLYGTLADANPRRFLEIGSGFSTKVARQSISDNNLRTTITSIDPYPRAEIDGICDRVIRKRLEDVDLSVFAELEGGDILFFDGSHRLFTNSDVAVIFLDVLPLLKPGVIVQIHDITLPDDYPAEWSGRYYNEQYMLAMLLLFSPDRFPVLFPNAHASRHLPLRDLLPATVGRVGLPDCKRGGGSFWMRVA